MCLGSFKWERDVSEADISNHRRAKDWLREQVQVHKEKIQNNADITGESHFSVTVFQTLADLVNASAHMAPDQQSRLAEAIQKLFYEESRNSSMSLSASAARAGLSSVSNVLILAAYLNSCC
ncbi:MAG: hypothetical protein JWN64_289 [Parcubacteria group bacterium]|nr:hypothetical protein [Parcubacteria group bacterium]